MKSYFRCDSARYSRIMKNIIYLTALPVFMSGVIGVLILLTNLRAFLYTEYFFMLLRFICLAVMLEILICFITVYKLQRRKERAECLTFAEIGLHSFVFSKFIGDYIFFGRRRIYRCVAAVSFSDVSSIVLDEKKLKITVTCKQEKIRIYEDDSPNLNHSFKDGKLRFDEWWFNECGYNLEKQIVIKNIFTEQRELYQSLIEAKSRYDALPPPRPYKHKEPDFIKRRKALEKLKNNKL